MIFPTLCLMRAAPNHDIVIAVGCGKSGLIRHERSGRDCPSHAPFNNLMDLTPVAPALILNIRTAYERVRREERYPLKSNRDNLLRRLNPLLDDLAYHANCLMEWTMPANGWDNKSAYGDFKFAAVSLSDNEKKDFVAWRGEQVLTVTERIAEMAMLGYKLSVSADLDNQCFVVSLTMRNVGHPHHNTTVTSRSDEWDEALEMTAYKLLRMYPDQPLPTARKKNNWG